MKTILVFSFLAGTHYAASAQQQTQSILLLDLTFDNAANPMLFDSTGPGANTGTNNWIVNNLYNGLPNYPNTPDEDSTVNGLIINNAPLSNYLHVYDATNTGGTANDNWNTGNASDRFCYTAGSFCTLGLDSVHVTFDWICQGDSNAYGQVYYTTGNGQWIQIGRPKYYNQTNWLYESIADTGMNNQANIQLGFRWVNTGSDSVTNEAFGIDDIFAEGTYNPADTNTAVTISAGIYNQQICQGDPVTFSLFLSRPLCDGNYEIELSDSGGDFFNPTNLGNLQVDQSFTGGFYNSTGTNPDLSGNCFKIRIVRTGPNPVLISDTSACFAISPCITSNTIHNLNCPVMTNDPDTSCILSEIDVQFNSLGTFTARNVYYAELSDTNGNFSDSTILGSLVTSDSFPSLPNADIAGLIPASVPPGCGYRIRVRSTDPPTVGYLPGTYCLVHCDELTNNLTDIRACVSSVPYPECQTINIATNHWNQGVIYDTCNNWTVELRNLQDFSFAGNLIMYHNTAGGNYSLCMPSTADSLPVQPGEYYMRIVSSCSSQPWNETGTVIRITMGAPNPTPPVIFFPTGDSIVCAINGSVAAVAVSPFNSPPSQYQWSSNLLNNGIPYIWPYQEILITLNNNVQARNYVFYVQEISYGCTGPTSAPGVLTVSGKPDATINGPTTVCIGDTAQFNVNFLPETYYSWSASPGVAVLNTSNVQTGCIFDSLGTYNVRVYILNECDSSTGTVQVKVVPPYFTVNTGPDTSVCKNAPVTLSANPSPVNKTFVVQDTSTGGRQGGMFNLVALGDVTIDSFAVKLLSRPQVLEAQIWDKPGSYQSFEQTRSAWTELSVNDNNPVALIGRFTTISAYVGQFIPAGDTFAFYITTVNAPVLNIAYDQDSDLQGSVYSSDGNMNFIQGTVLDYPFMNNVTGYGYVLNVEIYYTTVNGLQYTWSNGGSTPSISVAEADSGNYLYSVAVNDGGKCRVTDTSILQVLNCTTSVNNLTAPDDLFAIFPNPTTGRLSLEVPQDVLKVIIYDVQGAKIWEGPVSGNIIDISGISDGEYLLTAITAENIWKKKVILFR